MPHPTPHPPKMQSCFLLRWNYCIKLLRQALFLCYIAAKNTQYIYLRFSLFLL